MSEAKPTTREEVRALRLQMQREAKARRWTENPANYSMRWAQ